MFRSLAFIFLFSSFLSAAVIVETQIIPFNSDNDASAAFTDAVLAGHWDRLQLSVRVPETFVSEVTRHDPSGSAFRKVEGRAYFPVKKSSFETLSPANQRQMAALVLKAANREEVHAYKVWVDPTKNRLKDEPVIQRLGINVESLERRYGTQIPAEQLLSPYAQTWAYRYSQQDGQNCWHTSIASIFPDWTVERRMPADEFTCQVKESFEPIAAPEQWGDLIRLHYQGEEVHGYTFLGRDSQDPSRRLVFTKNGRSPSRFLFMKLEDVAQYVYPGNQMEFYRAVRSAIDPATHPDAPCAGKTDGWSDRDSHVDSLLKAQLQRAPQGLIRWGE